MITRKRLGTRVAVYEAAGFALVILFLWLNELADIPRLLGAAATPVNVAESVFETVLVLALGIAVVWVTLRFIRRVQFLEGFLPVCARCKRIRVRERWIPIEVYIDDHSEAEFTHSICPECFAVLYGDEMERE